MDTQKIIDILQSLQKWDCDTTDSSPFIDWVEDNKYGEWIKKEDIEDILFILKNKL